MKKVVKKLTTKKERKKKKKTYNGDIPEAQIMEDREQGNLKMGDSGCGEGAKRDSGE